MNDRRFEQQPQPKREAQISWETLQEIGFREGQDKSGPDLLEHNAGLYNLKGNKIGWGDINARDIDLFVKRLPEPLLILDEHASYWKFVTIPDSEERRVRKGPGSTLVVDTDSPLIRHVDRAEDSPGLKYILNNLRGLVVPNIMILQESGLLSPGYYVLLDDDKEYESHKKIPGTDFEYHVLSRGQVTGPLRDYLIRNGFLLTSPPKAKKSLLDQLREKLKKRGGV